MTDAIQTLETFCARIPGLVNAGSGMWELRDQSGQYFPAEGHKNAAEVEPRSFWFNHRNQVIASAVKAYPPQGIIFDIGGGNGYVSVGLKDAGFGAVVIEPGGDGAANAHARGFPVLRAPFQNLEIADNSIPAAGMFDVLEHIEDDRAALANLFRVLVPGGRLYIAVPAYSFLWSEEDIYARHYRRYTLGELRRKFRAAGFLVDYDTYFFAPLILPILMFRALPARLGRRKIGDVKQDHSLPRSLAGNVVRSLLQRESNHLSRGGRLSYGASCLIIGRKRSD